MRRPILALLITGAIIAACTKWQAVKTPPVQYLAQDKLPKQLKVRSDDREVILTSPRLVEDSLVGQHPPKYSGDPPIRVAIPLARIRSIETLQTDKTMSVVGIGLGVLGLAAIAVVALAGNVGPDYGGGSCPTVYSWTGTDWRLDSGTFAGALVRVLQRTDLDNLDFATPDGRLLRLRIAGELPEIDHIDALDVIAVDHAPGILVAPDPAGTLHGFRHPDAPISAKDFRGEDALERIRDRDDWSWYANPARRDSSRAADVRDGLVLRFLRPSGATTAHLIVDGRNTEWAAWLLWKWISAHGAATTAWYDSLNAQPLAARRAFLPIAREALLSASLITTEVSVPLGQFGEVGPEVGKRQVLHITLPATAGDTIVIRLETAPGLWRIDQVALAFGAEETLAAQPLQLRDARNSNGLDVANLLARTDGNELVLARGEHADLSFVVPELSSSSARTFLLRSTGWYRLGTPEIGPGDSTLLARVANEPLALSRIAVGQLNQALAPLRRPSP